MATNFGPTRCRSREKERCACVAKSSANILFNRSAKNDYLICADEKTSIKYKHLTSSVRWDSTIIVRHL